MTSRSSFSRNSVVFVLVLVTVSCLSVIIVSVVRLPDIPLASIRPEKLGNVFKYRIGKFGEMMIQMLPDDLPFTIFLPSDNAFERDLKLNVNESLIFMENYNDTFALVSRILGFSVVPRTIDSDSVGFGKEVSYDSLSGFGLFVYKDLDGMLVVNGVRSELVDVRKGKIVLHIMDGVIMDADFEQSVRPDYGDEA